MPRVQPSTPPAALPVGLAVSARAWAEAADFDSARVRRLAVARTKAPTAGPESVQRAFALHRAWQESDLGSTRLFRVPIGAATVWAIHTTTDGDDAFVELFDGRGAPLASGVRSATAAGGFATTWDTTFGAVRARISPPDVSPSVAAFSGAIDAAGQAASPHGARIDVAEARAAAQHLVGAELSARSVDAFEATALHRALADAAPRMTHGAKTFVSRLGELYLDASPQKLRDVRDAPAIGGTSAFAAQARFAEAVVSGRKSTPHATAFLELGKSAWSLLPTQVVPATATEARAALMAAGASAAEADATCARLTAHDRALFVGRLFTQGDDWVPTARGSAVFAASTDGKSIAGVYVPAAAPAPVEARAVIAGLTGVDRAVEVLETTSGASGEVSRLRWAPPMGGELRARLTVPAGGEPTVDELVMAPVNEAALESALRGHLTAALGPTRVLGWVGRDDASGPGFLVVHQPDGASAARLALVRIQLGGAATVTPRALTPSAADAADARDLALVVARHHAEAMVSDPALPAAARLEVALRTRWAQPSSLEAIAPDDSAVGFDPATDAHQLALMGVWGDNAVFVTFAQDGAVRVEDVN